MRSVYTTGFICILLSQLLFINGCFYVYNNLFPEDYKRREREVKKAASKQDVDYLINALLHDRSGVVRNAAAAELGKQKVDFYKIIPALTIALRDPYYEGGFYNTCCLITSYGEEIIGSSNWVEPTFPVHEMALTSLNNILNYALMTDPNNKFYIGLSYLLTMQLINDKLEQGAIRLIFNDVYNIVYWLEYGRLSILNNHYHGAITAFNAVLQLNKQCWAAYKHLGIALMKTNQYKEAKKNYEDALRLHQDSELWSAYGYCLIDLNSDQKAMEAFQKSIKLNSDHISIASAKLGASAILKRQGDEDAAKKLYEEAIKINPEINKILVKQKDRQETDKHN